MAVACRIIGGLSILVGLLVGFMMFSFAPGFDGGFMGLMIGLTCFASGILWLALAEILDHLAAIRRTMEKQVTSTQQKTSA